MMKLAIALGEGSFTELDAQDVKYFSLAAAYRDPKTAIRLEKSGVDKLRAALGMDLGYEARIKELEHQLKASKDQERYWRDLADSRVRDRDVLARRVAALETSHAAVQVKLNEAQTMISRNA